MSYASEVLADNPVGYWRLNETSGSTADDASGNDNDGTHIGPTLGASSLNSNFDTAAQYDGVDDRTTTPFTPSGAHFGSGGAVEFWVRFLSQPASNERHMLGVWGSPRCYFGWRVDTGDNDRDWQVGWGDSFANDLGSVEVETWYHIVASFDGTTLRFYIDATEVTSFSASFSGTNDPFWIGATNDGGSILNPMDAIVDEVAVYDSHLSASRIQAHYDAAFAEPDTAPIIPPPALSMTMRGF